MKDFEMVQEEEAAVGRKPCTTGAAGGRTPEQQGAAAAPTPSQPKPALGGPFVSAQNGPGHQSQSESEKMTKPHY